MQCKCKKYIGNYYLDLQSKSTNINIKIPSCHAYKTDNVLDKIKLNCFEQAKPFHRSG